MNIKRSYLIYFLILLLIIGILFIMLSKQNNQKIVCIKTNCFYVELAKTIVERERGLMFNNQLENNSGMLFIFENSGNHSFWMKNTLMALDIIWISDDLNIVYIKENALPCKQENCEIFSPNNKSLYVLEINANQIMERNISIGDKVKFN